MFPQKIDEVPIDIIQANYKAHTGLAIEPELEGPEPDLLEPLSAAESDGRRVRFDTLQPGISVSHPNVPSGTLGTVVFDRQTGRMGILSNWHVFVGSLAGAIPGDPIVQPGRKFGGRSPQDRIATLERFLLDQHGDAVASLTAASAATVDQFETGVLVTRAKPSSPERLL